ncbi:tyrosine-type recombinase/integrase [Methylobacterium sp. SI9]|uniref:tyrosine-type recombinase/integrase n=1 Tax=Methylobacterium guangdongense TaxID=3138811 RepID=UPI00313E8BB9
MRVRLKGINTVRKALADGSPVTYHYAWKGGPRLEGKPGTPKFIASYHAAVARRREPSKGTLLHLLMAFQMSADFTDRATQTKLDYIRQIKIIEATYADFPIAALADRRTRAEFLEWRDRLALRSRRQADYAWTVLARVLSWALKRGIIEANPCEKGGRLYRGTRAEKVWTDDDEATFLRLAPAHLHLALTLALWTGQRQGDLLRLTWHAYDGRVIRLQQSKTGARVVIPVGGPLKAALDAAARHPTILATIAGTAWTSDGFHASWRKACAKAGITGVTFNDLRGTAVTRLALAGSTEAEIATITGHALRDVRSILDAHYLNRDPALAESAIRKLEARHDGRSVDGDRTNSSN